MTSDIWWYTARAGGVVAWVLSAACVLWGIVLSSPRLRRGLRVEGFGDLHRLFGVLALMFTGVHGLALVLDANGGLRAADLVVPFAADVEPGATSLGVVALYALVLVALTSALRARLGEVVFRRAHLLGYLVFVSATAHQIQIGTDADHPLLRWPTLIVCVAVAASAAVRVFTKDETTNASDPYAPPSTVQPVATHERPSADVLSRTLEGLRNLEALPIEPAPVSRPGVEDLLVPPAPLTPRQALSGSLFSTTTPRPPDIAVPQPFDPGRDAPRDPAREPDLPQPTRAVPAAAGWLDAPVFEQQLTVPTAPTIDRAVPTVPTVDRAESGLPVRTPRRLARTTAAAATIDAWQPARGATSPAPPPPPNEVDPITGEPDPQAYRKWLREWLAYVESQA